MFRELKSEAIISFDIITESPLFIKSGEDNSLNPTASDSTYITAYIDGKIKPIIPGSSIKGVFRSRAERMLRSLGACDIVANNACVKDREKNIKSMNGNERYKISCPVCKLFGSKILKSRINFTDAVVTGEYKVGNRTCVGIDRISGAARGGALYNMEYVEQAIFKESIRFQNFEPWQIKLIIELLEQMNEGFITLGGLSSKGFGRVKAENISLKLKYYGSEKLENGYEFSGYYNTKTIDGIENITALLKNINYKNIGKDGDVNVKAI